MEGSEKFIGILLENSAVVNSILTLLELQSHFGDNRFKFQVVCPQIGTAVLKGLKSSETSLQRARERVQAISTFFIFACAGRVRHIPLRSSKARLQRELERGTVMCTFFKRGTVVHTFFSTRAR